VCLHGENAQTTTCRPSQRIVKTILDLGEFLAAFLARKRTKTGEKFNAPATVLDHWQRKPLTSK
jgi:hypothetical protein